MFDSDTIISKAKSRARELGRSDKYDHILDLIADELPRDHYNAAGFYLATERHDALSSAWAIMGGRGEYSGWVFDLLRELGTWVSWEVDGKVRFALRPSWAPPKPKPKPTRVRASTYTEGTDEVTVRTPCTCGVDRWFKCRCSEHVATYGVAIDEDGLLDPVQLWLVKAKHPGCDLIFLGPGGDLSWLDAAAQAEAAERGLDLETLKGQM